MLEVVPHQARWASDFAQLKAELTLGFGEQAIAISHIGSTAIQGLVAKPIIDVQVSVRALEDLRIPKELPEGCRYVPENDQDIPPLGYQQEPSEWRKRFMHVTRLEQRFAHIHIREVGRANERVALLFRDFVSEHLLHREAYGRLKLQLAEVVGHLTSAGGSGPYVELKDPLIAVILTAAEQWATATAWTVERSR